MKKILLLIVAASLMLSACAQVIEPQAPVVQNEAPAEQAQPAQEQNAQPAEPAAMPEPPATPTGEISELTVMTHDSFAVSEGVIAEFETRYNAKVSFLKAGDAGAVLNKAILSKDAPLADILYGVDNTFLSRALDANIYEAYASPLLQNIPDEFRLDQKNRALPMDYGDVCINYSKSFFAKNELPVPASLDDLLKPEYFGMLVVENPATSSPGLAFLLATIQQYGDPGYLDYWAKLKENGLVVVDGWETAYYTNFTGSSGFGPQPMVVSYSTSPAAEVVFAATELSDSPTASISAPGTCFRQIEFAGILAGTKNRVIAEAFIDFMLDIQFQESMPLNMFVYPVNPKATIPDVFGYYGQPAAEPAFAPDGLEANRDRWIQDWTATVMQ